MEISLPGGREGAESPKARSPGALIVEAGGLVEVNGTGGALLGQTGPGAVLVTGANSKLTCTNGEMLIGQQTGGSGSILTIADSGLVQTKTLKFGLDSGTSGFVHMAAGGILAVFGDKTGGTPFASGGLFTTGGNGGEIQYDNGGWTNMTGAVENTDYTLEYQTSGDLNGYTVLTMLGGTPPAADPEITSITSLGSGNWELKLKGEPSTTYEFRSSPTLDFTPGDLVAPLTVTLGGGGPLDVTTNGIGDATVEASLGDLGAVPANFVRAVGP